MRTPGHDDLTLAETLHNTLDTRKPGALDTHSDELTNGVNRCLKCGSSDIRLKVGNDVLVCQHCRHQWLGTRVEEPYGLGIGLGQLEGTTIASGAQDIDQGTASLMSFRCGGCGAEVTINTQNSMTARCHWCRHTLGVNERVANGAVPDAVLPFRIPREEAVANIRQFVGKRRFFALTAFNREFKPENVVGVYLPYMVVDSRASAFVTGTGEVQTRKYTVGSGKNRRDVYDADVYDVHREIDFTVDDLPLESSAERRELHRANSTNNIINAILPFDTKNAVKWNAAFLNGYNSEKRDLDVDMMHPRLENQLLTIARSRIERSVEQFDRGVCWQREGLKVHGTRWVSMYLPVWLYSYHVPGPDGGVLHYMAVNGRTAETMGSVPVQRWKLAVAAGLAALLAHALIAGLVLALLP